MGPASRVPAWSTSNATDKVRLVSPEMQSVSCGTWVAGVVRECTLCAHCRGVKGGCGVVRSHMEYTQRHDRLPSDGENSCMVGVRSVGRIAADTDYRMIVGPVR